jgi:hypothetical protein
MIDKQEVFLMAQPINLQDPKTFRNLTLNTAQFNQRYQILQEAEETLADQGKELTPRSKKELSDLSDLFTKSTVGVLVGRYPVHRLTAPHYFVQFGVTSVDKYKEVGTHLVELPKSGVGVIQAVQPNAADNWFHKAIVMQTAAVFKSDFMDALRCAFIANICLLRASSLLVKEPAIFRQILDLYGNSHDLYQDQIAFNRRVELKLIESAEDSHTRIENFHRQIAQICGSQLEEKPAVIDSALILHKDETAQALALYTDLRNYCDEFLTKISTLEKKITHCIKSIATKQDLIVDALGKINALMIQQQDLNKKKDQLQKDFDKFQETKEKEWKSRKEEREGGGSVSFLGITIWSEAPTIKIVEADFGSKQAFDDYLKIRAETAQLTQQLEAAKNHLTTSMLNSGILHYGQDTTKLTDAISSLSAALASVKELELALKIRKSQAETQIETCQSFLRVGGSGMFKGIDEVLGFLEASLARIVKQKSLWLESNRQTLTLQDCRKLEGGIRLKVTNALVQLAEGNDSAIGAISDELQKFLPTNATTPKVIELFNERLVSNVRMLEFVKEGNN